MVIVVDHSMDSCRYPQALNVRLEASRKVLAESGLLCLIKEVSIPLFRSSSASSEI